MVRDQARAIIGGAMNTTGRYEAAHVQHAHERLKIRRT
jgi:hypothetical protein